MNTIEIRDIIELLKTLLKFPNGQICKHHVMTKLLSLLEAKGLDLYPHIDLIRAIVNADDDRALELIDGLV